MRDRIYWAAQEVMDGCKIAEEKNKNDEIAKEVVDLRDRLREAGLAEDTNFYAIRPAKDGLFLLVGRFLNSPRPSDYKAIWIYLPTRALGTTYALGIPQVPGTAYALDIPGTPPAPDTINNEEGWWEWIRNATQTVNNGLDHPYEKLPVLYFENDGRPPIDLGWEATQKVAVVPYQSDQELKNLLAPSSLVQPEYRSYSLVVLAKAYKGPAKNILDIHPYALKKSVIIHPPVTDTNDQGIQVFFDPAHQKPFTRPTLAFDNDSLTCYFTRPGFQSMAIPYSIAGSRLSFSSPIWKLEVSPSMFIILGQGENYEPVEDCEISISQQKIKKPEDKIYISEEEAKAVEVQFTPKAGRGESIRYETRTKRLNLLERKKVCIVLQPILEEHTYILPLTKGSCEIKINEPVGIIKSPVEGYRLRKLKKGQKKETVYHLEKENEGPSKWIFLLVTAIIAFALASPFVFNPAFTLLFTLSFVFASAFAIFLALALVL